MVKRLYLGYSDGASSNLALGTKLKIMESEKKEKPTTAVVYSMLGFDSKNAEGFSKIVSIHIENLDFTDDNEVEGVVNKIRECVKLSRSVM